MSCILFVCTGNTCRSPMAEALAKFYFPRLQVSSAGLFVSNGDVISKNAVLALREKNIEMEHQPSQITIEKMEWADHILTMTHSHKKHLLHLFPSAMYKVETLKEFILNEKGDVIDPFSGSIEMYRETCRELDKLIQQLGSMMKN